MITTAGRLHIKKYLAEIVPHIAQSIALGIGTSPESVEQTTLDFEVIRADITNISYDFTTDRIIYKATIPPSFVGTIYEAALFSQSSNTLAQGFGSTMITAFDTGELWTGSFATGTRYGADGLSLTPAASSTVTNTLSGLSRDFSGYSDNDQFSFAFNVGNANTSTLSFMFMTDSSNYYTFALGAQTAGYKITKVNKSTATVTGTPTWEFITQIQVTATSGSGGASSILLDAIRIEDVDTINPEYAMVSRELLTTPFVKEVPMNQDAEFALAVDIT